MVTKNTNLELKEKTPGELADELLELSSLYGRYSDRMADIIEVKPMKWSILREDVSSDRQADRLWEQTEIGAEEAVLELRMKNIAQKMSAIKRVLNVRELEAKNQV